MARLPDTNQVTKRTIELMGGIEAFRQITNDEFVEMEQRWYQDVEAIGRILRSHLYVEHYLTEYIEKANPRLGSVKNARLSFAQKLELVDSKDHTLTDLLPGIRHLNTIRNRLAHNLSTAISEKDAEIFLGAKAFNALRIEAAKPRVPSGNPLDILESFAQHAASRLRHQFSQLGNAIAQAMKEAQV